MKKCSNCSSEMDLTLRTLYLKKKIEIKNVPVYSCNYCEENIIVEQIEGKVKKVIEEKKEETRKQIIEFERYSEFAQLLIMLYNKQKHSDEKRIEKEIERLLEKYAIDHSLEQDIFEQVVHKKITKMLH